MPWEAQERWCQFDLTFQELNKTSNDTLSDVQVQPTRFYRQGSICKGKRERGYEVSESVRCLDAFATEQLTEAWPLAATKFVQRMEHFQGMDLQLVVA